MQKTHRERIKKNKTEIQLQTKRSCHGSKFQFSFPYLMQIQQVIAENTDRPAKNGKKAHLFPVPSSGIFVNYKRSKVRRETQGKKRNSKETENSSNPIRCFEERIPSVPHIPLGT
jgi:hypothetical protein